MKDQNERNSKENRDAEAKRLVDEQRKAREARNREIESKLKAREDAIRQRKEADREAL